MDEHYNKINAAASLEKAVLERGYLAKDNQKNYNLADIETGGFEVVQMDNPKCWKILEVDKNGYGEELLLRVQGAIFSKMLPPIAKPANRAVMVKQRPYLKQSLSLTGLGTKNFEKATEALDIIYLAFANKLPDGAMLPAVPVLYDGNIGIEASTRYFDRKHKDSQQEDNNSAQFGPFVDPHGVLQSMETDGYWHGEENMVRYAVKTENAEGGIEYRSLDPATIRVGDIVEVSLGFIAYPCKEGKFKMVNRLRGVLLLDQQERDKATILRMRGNSSSTAAKTGSKRKALYGEEEAVEDTRRRMSKMKID